MKNSASISFFLLALSCLPSRGAEEPDSPPPLEFFMNDRVLSEKGYFIISKGRAETDVISGLRQSLSGAPANKNFDCRVADAKIDLAVDEGFDRDSFFFSTKNGNLAMLTMIDVHGDYSKAYRPKELDIVQVRGGPATLSLTVARGGGAKTTWGVGWRYMGASAGVYVEDKSPPALSKEQVLAIAESIQCTRK